MLSHEEHGGLDPKDYVTRSTNSPKGQLLDMPSSALHSNHWIHPDVDTAGKLQEVEDEEAAHWIHPDVDTAEKLKEVAVEESSREEDAMLTHEEHGGLDPKDYVAINNSEQSPLAI